MPSRNLTIAVTAGLALSLGTFTAHGGELDKRPDDAAFGKEISEADLEYWDIDIQAPTGKGLPPGEGAVSEGRKVYENQCLACHGEEAGGGPVYGSMVGGIGSMTKRPRTLTPGSMYPYAPILFDYVRRAMPMDKPHSMSNDEVYAVSAYIYYLNGLVDEDFTMNADTMPKIEMPNRDAFIEDDRPDTRAERCMSDCEPIGTVADAQE